MGARGTRHRASLSLLSGLCVALFTPAARAQVVYQVGTFTSRTTPGAQTVPHGLGAVPQAILVWTGSRTANGVTEANSGFSVGLSDGSGQASVGAGEVGGGAQATSRCLHPSVVCVVNGSQVVLADASLSAVSTSSLSLNWNKADGVARLVHFLVLGGSGVSSKLVMWQSPGTKTDVPVTGFGFKPDFVLTLASGSTTESVPDVSADAHIHFSVLTPSTSWELGGFSGLGVVTHYLVPAVVSMSQGGNAYDLATLKSLDPDGFTLTWSQVGNQPLLASLGVRGVPAKAGKFISPAPNGSPTQTQEVTGVGFEAGAVILGSAMDVTLATSADEVRWSFGATDGVHAAGTAFRDVTATSPTSVFGIDSNTEAVLAPDGGVGATATVDVHDGGFRVTWTTLPAGGQEVDYLALGGVVRPPDAGSPGLDAGTLPGLDGGEGGAMGDGGGIIQYADGGHSPGRARYSVGCGCGAGAGESTLGGLLLLVLLRRRSVAK